MKISILIAAYNAEGFIQNAIESALCQSMSAHEIIVVDDCSTDGTEGMVRAFMQEQGGERIKLLRTEKNSGPAYARNMGLAAAKGDWISILDADDFMAEDRLERLAACAMDSGADIVADNVCYYYADEKDVSKPLFHTGAAFRDITLAEFFKSARPGQQESDYGLLKPMIRRDFLRTHNIRYPEHSRHGEDFLFMADLLLAGAQYVLAPEVGYFYSARSTGRSRTRVNYHGMIQQTHELAQDPRLVGRDDLKTLLDERAQALSILAIQHDLSVLFQKKDFGGLMSFAMKSPSHFSLAARKSARFVLKYRKRVHSAIWRRVRAPIISLYLKKQVRRMKVQIETEKNQKAHPLPAPLIVSLTSWPPRFKTLHLTLLSLLTQDMRPDHVILWVADVDYAALPKEVLDLQSHGLEISTCDDLGPYKKIVPALASDPDAFIVTADDDVYYGPKWLSALCESWDGNLKTIVCHRAHRIAFSVNGAPASYTKWRHNAKGPQVSASLFPTGAGGVLYPPGCFSPDVLQSDVFMDLCPRADDVWLYWMAAGNGCAYLVTNYGADVLNWDDSQKTSLLTENVTHGGNDRQIKKMMDAYGFPAAG